MKIYKKILFANFMAFLTIMLLFISLAIPRLNVKETKYKQVEWQKELWITAFSRKGIDALGYYESTTITIFLYDVNLPYPQYKYANQTELSYCYKVDAYVNNTLIRSFDKSNFVYGIPSRNAVSPLGEDYASGKCYDGCFITFEIDYIENVNSTQFSAIGFYRKSEPYYVDVFRYDILEQYLFNGLLYSVIAVAVIWLLAFLYFQIKGFYNWLRT